MARAVGLSGAGNRRVRWTDPAPGAAWGRTDQGVDWSGVRRIVAVAPGTIVAVYNNLSGFGNTIIERLSSGKEVYYAQETAGTTTTVREGQRVRAGQTLADRGTGGGIEVGFWNPSTGHAAGYQPGVQSGGQTLAGRQFRQMLTRGADPGIQAGSQSDYLAKLWIEAGGSPHLANLMAAIAMAESSGRTNATNTNTNGTTDYGLWQINSSHGYDASKLLSDPLYNAKAAVAIEKSQGLGAWTTYTSGAYRQFLGQGSSAKVTYGGPNGGRTRPGGKDSSADIDKVLTDYTSLRDTPRTAPPNTKNPFQWWWASFTGNWDQLGGNKPA